GADPDAAAVAAYGRPLAQLEEEWGRTLARESGAAARTPGRARRFLGLAWPHLRPHRFKLAEVVVSSALTVAFGIFLALMQGLLLDRALIPRDRHALVVIMGALVGAFALATLAALRESYLTAYVAESVLRQLRLRTFAALQRPHPGVVQQIEGGDILSRMTGDLNAVGYALTGALARGLRPLLTLVAATVAILVLDWRLGLVALLGTPLFFVTGRYLEPAAARAGLERQERLAEATSLLREHLGAQPVVKAFGLQERAIGDYAARLER